MAKRDEYGPLLEQALREHPEGMSPRELYQAVGCSQQRAYAWIKQNRSKLRSVGKNDTGALRFVIKDHPVRDIRGVVATTAGKSPGAGVSEDSAAGFQVGAAVMVRSMRWTDGQLEIGLEADDGSELMAVVVL